MIFFMGFFMIVFYADHSLSMFQWFLAGMPQKRTGIPWKKSCSIRFLILKDPQSSPNFIIVILLIITQFLG